VIDNSFVVLSIQMMSVLQAIDYLGCQSRLAPHTLSVYNSIREIFPKFVEDQPKYKCMGKVKDFLENSDPVISFKATAFTNQ
jgi:histidine ammonia-lyase